MAPCSEEWCERSRSGKQRRHQPHRGRDDGANRHPVIGLLPNLAHQRPKHEEQHCLPGCNDDQGRERDEDALQHIPALVIRRKQCCSLLGHEPQDRERAAVTKELHEARGVEPCLAELRRLEELHLAERRSEDERKDDHDNIAQEPHPAFLHGISLQRWRAGANFNRRDSPLALRSIQVNRLQRRSLRASRAGKKSRAPHKTRFSETPYSGLMPAALRTALHLAISARMNASNSAGLLPTSSSPCAASRAFIAGFCAILATSACSRAITAAGVRAGAAMPGCASSTIDCRPTSDTGAKSRSVS